MGCLYQIISIIDYSTVSTFAIYRFSLHVHLANSIYAKHLVLVYRFGHKLDCRHVVIEYL